MDNVLGHLLNHHQNCFWRWIGILNVHSFQSMVTLVSDLMPSGMISGPCLIVSKASETEFKDWELVVVVTDLLTEVSFFWKLPQRILIRVLREHPRGVAVNSGLAACAGSYVARMDADDRMCPEKRSSLFTTWNSGRFCGSRVKPFTEEGPVKTFNDTMTGVIPRHWWGNTSRSFCGIPHHAIDFLWTKKLYEFLGGYLEQPWAEDYDFLLRAAHKSPLWKCPEVLLKTPCLDRLSGSIPFKNAMMRAKVHYHEIDGPFRKCPDCRHRDQKDCGPSWRKKFPRGICGTIARALRSDRFWATRLGVSWWSAHPFLESFTKSLIVLGIELQVTIDDDSTSKAKWMGRKSKLCEDGMSDDELPETSMQVIIFSLNSSIKNFSWILKFWVIFSLLVLFFWPPSLLYLLKKRFRSCFWKKITWTIENRGPLHYIEAHDFEGEMASGKKASLADFSGNSYLNFWATWWSLPKRNAGSGSGIPVLGRKSYSTCSEYGESRKGSQVPEKT